MYTRVESRFWQDEKMRAVSPDARYLMLYLLTSPHRNVLGFYFLPEPYACFDLGWTKEWFRERLGELLRNGLVKYDETAHVVLIINFLKHNPLENQNQVKSAIEKLNEIPKTPLFKDFYEAVKKYSYGKSHYSSLLEQLEERLQEQLPQQFGEPFGKQEKEKEEGKEKEEVEEEVEVKEKEPLPEQLKDDNDDTANPFKYYQQNIGPLLPDIVDLIEQYRKDLPDELITEAFKIAVLNNARNMRYAEKVMISWLDKGIKTMDDYRRHEAEWASRKNNNSSRRERDGTAKGNTGWGDGEEDQYAGIGITL